LRERNLEVVDFYTAEAAKAEVVLNNYYVADFPNIV